MGSFWIFFLFMGIVALIKRNEIANEGKKSQGEQPTADDIRREFERRVKELKGEDFFARPGAEISAEIGKVFI